MEPAGISLSWIAREDSDELVRESRFDERRSLHEELRDRQAHLCVVRVVAGRMPVARVLAVAAEIVLGEKAPVHELEGSAVGVTDGDLQKHSDRVL